MNKELIKADFTAEVEKIITIENSKTAHISGFNKINLIQQRMIGAKVFGENITGILNEIAEKYNVKDEDIKDLTEYLKPTIADLIKRYVQA